MKEMRNENPNVKPHINELVEKGQFQIVEKMIKLGAYLEYSYNNNNHKKRVTMVDKIINGDAGYKPFLGALLCTSNEKLRD
jgi:hypothetical protein